MPYALTITGQALPCLHGYLISTTRLKDIQYVYISDYVDQSIQLRNALVYCSTLVVTGRAYIERVQPIENVQSKFQRNKDLKNIINTTQQHIYETIEYLKPYTSTLHSPDHEKGMEQLNPRQTVTNNNSYDTKQVPKDKQDKPKDIIRNTIPFTEEEKNPKNKNKKKSQIPGPHKKKRPYNL